MGLADSELKIVIWLILVTIFLCFKQDRNTDGEILDEMVTRSRGEIRRICSPKVTSSTETPIGDSKGLHSPRFSEKAYSPRVSELRQEQSPLSGGKGPYSPRTGEARPSKLGQPAPHSASK